MKKLQKAIIALCVVCVCCVSVCASAPGSISWSGSVDLSYRDADNVEMTYPTQTEIIVSYDSYAVATMYISIINPSAASYVYKMQEISGLSIVVDGTTLGAQFYQAYYSADLNTDMGLIHPDVRTTVYYDGASVLNIKVRFSIPETAPVPMYLAISRMLQVSQDHTDTSPTSWGMLYLANAAINDTVSDLSLTYTASYLTPIEIDEMITQGQSGSLSDIYVPVYEPPVITPGASDDVVIDGWQDLWDEQRNEEFFDSIHNSLSIIESNETMLVVNGALTTIMGMPYMVSVVPIAMFFILGRIFLH